MNQFTIVLTALLLATLVSRIRAEEESIDNEAHPDNFLRIINRSCPTPDSADTMSAEELKQEEDNRSAISGFILLEPPLASLMSQEHLTGADFLEPLTRDNFRENLCNSFLPIEPALSRYLQNRAKCLRNRMGDIQLLVAFYKTICASDFEETLTDVVGRVGDDCIDDLFQLIRGKAKPNPENLQACSRTNDKFRELREKNLAEFKEGYLKPMFKNCVLSHVGSTCGAEAAAQVQRLTGRLLNAMTI